jgi:hypothetical protein
MSFNTFTFQVFFFDQMKILEFNHWTNNKEKELDLESYFKAFI